MTIQLHAFDTPKGRKISVAFEEMGLPCAVRIVDIGRAEQFDPAFLAISPNNKIPAIVDPQGADAPGGRLRPGDLSIADFAIVGWVWRHARHQVDLADFPHVQRWYQTMLARPAVARGFAVPLRRG